MLTSKSREGASAPVQIAKSGATASASASIADRNRSQTDAIVREREVEAASDGAAHTDRVAAQGTDGAGSRLPHLDRIQAAFGRHDVSGVQAHVGGPAASATKQLGAEGYARGNHVAFGQAPDLHTAAHEAAHVVQQRAGIARKSDTPGDAYERHADAVADRVVAGQSAEALLSEVARHDRAAAPAPVVQRKIMHGTVELPTTWKKIAGNCDKSVQDAAQVELDRARTLIGTIDDEKLERAWNKAANAKPTTRSTNTYDLLVKDEVAEAVRVRASRSKKSSENRQKRVDTTGEIVEPLSKARGGLHLTQSAFQTLEPDTPHQHQYEFLDKGWQEQRHLSTMVLHKYGGIESQSSFSTDQMDVAISTNEDDVNSKIESELKNRTDIKDLTSTIAMSLGLKTMTREEAMQNRKMRHALKLYARISEHLKDKTATITVPGVGDLDGQHAEIRIEKLKDDRKRYQPSGTKLPCLGCTLYFYDNGYVQATISSGPMWLSFSALSSQIEQVAQGAKKLGDLSEEQVASIGKLLAAQYEKIVKDGNRLNIGHGKTRSGTYTTDHDPDSGSDLDEDTFTETKNRIEDRFAPQYDGDGKQEKRDRPKKRKRQEEEDKRSQARKVGDEGKFVLTDGDKTE